MAEGNKLISISAFLIMHNGKSNNGIRRSLLMDNGILYEINSENDKGTIQSKRSFTPDMMLINKGKGSGKRYIKTDKGYVKTGIYEYKRFSGYGTMKSYEAKTKNFIIVYNHPYQEDKNYAKRLQVFSRKTGKKVLDLTSKLLVNDLNDPERIGVKYIAKKKAVQEVIFNRQTNQLKINIYDLNGTVVKGKTYNLQFKVNKNDKLTVLYLKNKDNMYVLLEHNGTADFYSLEGTELKQVQLKVPPDSIVKNLDSQMWEYGGKWAILKVYNPEKKKLEYLVRTKNTEGKYYTTEDFPLFLASNTVKSVFTYKNYKVVLISTGKKDQPYTATVYRKNKEWFSFAVSNMSSLRNFKDIAMTRKGKYIYIVIVKDNDVQLLKFNPPRNLQQKATIEPVKKKLLYNSKAIKVPGYNKNNGAKYPVTDEGKLVFFITGGNLSMRSKYPYMAEADFLEGYNHSFWTGDGDFRIFEMLRSKGMSFKVISDNAFVLNNVLIVSNKNDYFYSQNFKICCDKAVFSIPIGEKPASFSRERVFVYDFKKQKVDYVYFPKEVKPEDFHVLINPLNQTDTAYVLSSKGFSREPVPNVLYKLNLHKSKIVAKPVFTVRDAGNMQMFFSNNTYKLYCNRGKYTIVNTHGEDVKDCFPIDVEYYIYKNRMYNIERMISFRFLKDLKLLTDTREKEKVTIKGDELQDER
jgi:hypothetical protein